MAEGFIRHYLPGAEVFSAGTHPAKQVHPLAVEVMAEKGIDLRHHRPEPVEKYLDRAFDYVLTVCDEARENCPVFTGPVRHRLHRAFDDPAAFEGPEPLQKAYFRHIRDRIEDFIRQWTAGLEAES